MVIRRIRNGENFDFELRSAGDRLVLAEFTAKWCAACRNIDRLYEDLSDKYPIVVFLRVDVDECPDTAITQDVHCMPTFVFYYNHAVVGRSYGTDMLDLETRIIHAIIDQMTSNGDSSDGPTAASDTMKLSDNFAQILMDINPFLLRRECKCLNERTHCTLANCLEGIGPLISDSSEQMVMFFTFNQPMTIHSLRIRAPGDFGPKDVKLSVNRPNIADFAKVDEMIAVKCLTFSQNDLEMGKFIILNCEKFQNVTNVQLVVRKNQSGNNATQIDYIGFIGMPTTSNSSATSVNSRYLLDFVNTK